MVNNKIKENKIKENNKIKEKNPIPYRYEEIQNLIVTIPKNFFIDSDIQENYGMDVFSNKVEEKRELEQFFWTRNVVMKILKGCQYITNCCCFTTPSLANAFFQDGRDEKLLDIDERFNYLKYFEKFDIKNPHVPDGAGDFNIIVIDPPFFNITIKELFDATNVITNYNYKTNIIIAHITRFDHTLIKTFEPYGLSETSTPLEYAHVKPNKWNNFKLYSNIDLPGIKRIPGKYGYKSH